MTFQVHVGGPRVLRKCFYPKSESEGGVYEVAVGSEVSRPRFGGDFYIVEQHGPDFRPEPFAKALGWFKVQNQTLGG